MNSRLLRIVAFLAVVGTAMALRAPRLDLRPMHADEAVHAARFRRLWLENRFVYDPNEFHGPTLYYATLPAVWLTRPADFAATTEATYRGVSVVLSLCGVAVVFALGRAMGRPAAWAGAGLLAVSPAAVFYGRYYIHETLLAVLSLAAIAAAWRWVRGGRLGWCLATGALVGLMQATKETAVLAYAAAAVALALTWCVGRLRRDVRDAARQPTPAMAGLVERAAPDGPSPHATVPGALRRFRPGHLVAAAAVAVAVAIVFYSSFGANPRGPIDAVRTYTPWLSRAGGASPHIHPWYFYLHRMLGWRQADGPWWSEAAIVALAGLGWIAALVGPRRRRPHAVAEADSSPAALRDMAAPPCALRETGSSPPALRGVGSSPGTTTPPSPTPAAESFVAGGAIEPHGPIDTALPRWLGFYVVLLAGFYSAIPYKTPWCALEWLAPATVLAGFGAARLIGMVRSRAMKAIVAAGLLAAAAHLGYQAHRAAFRMVADPRNPYVYAQTSSDVLRLSGDLEQLAAASPVGHRPAVQVVWTDAYYWPLPWYLRRFEQVEPWTKLPPASRPVAPLVVFAPAHDAALSERLDATHLMVGYYELRPGALCGLFVRMDLWEAHLRRLGRL